MEAGSWIGLGLFVLIAIIAARAIFSSKRRRGGPGDSGVGVSVTAEGRKRHGPADSDSGGSDGGGDGGGD